MYLNINILDARQHVFQKFCPSIYSQPMDLFTKSTVSQLVKKEADVLNPSNCAVFFIEK
jgi:hypothetical protein